MNTHQGLTAEELRAEADKLDESTANHREAVEVCQREAATFNAEMDTILAELRAALPGCEQ